MITIFIMYSPDRREALDYTLHFLREMPLYETCQRILVIDGKELNVPDDWDAISVPRVDGKFCWGRMWDAGVGAAIHEKVLYLDSDRLLPANFLTEIESKVQDDVFLFTSKHFHLLRTLTKEQCSRLLHAIQVDGGLLDGEFIGACRYEPRFDRPTHGPGKNVMSGCTAFTRKTYLSLRGVDHWYCGHGAYADSDFMMAASVAGCRFIDLNLPELHFPHDKKEADKSLSDAELFALSLQNFLYYSMKWSLPAIYAENLALRCGVNNPRKYVSERLAKLKAVAKES